MKFGGQPPFVLQIENNLMFLKWKMTWIFFWLEDKLKKKPKTIEITTMVVAPLLLTTDPSFSIFLFFFSGTPLLGEDI